MDAAEAPALVRQVTPTIERARELGVLIPEGAPREVLPLAVLRVACRAQFRRSWPPRCPTSKFPYGARALEVVLVARPEGTIERIGSDDAPAP